MIIIVNKSVETRVTISVKDGTDKHVKSVPNKDVDLSGAMEDPRFQIRVLESAIATIKGEMSQTTLSANPPEKPDAGPKKITDDKKPDAGPKKIVTAGDKKKEDKK